MGPVREIRIPVPSTRLQFSLSTPGAKLRKRNTSSALRQSVFKWTMSLAIPITKGRRPSASLLYRRVCNIVAVDLVGALQATVDRVCETLVGLPLTAVMTAGAR